MDPSNFFPGDDVGERANAELTEPDPLITDFTPTPAAASESLLISGLGSCYQGLLFDMINFESQQKQDPAEFQPWLEIPSNSDQHRGVEHTGMATTEQCSNNQVDSMVSGIHCHNTRSGSAQAVNSNWQVISHSFDHQKDELDRLRKQEHCSINHKSSQGASCSALSEAIGNEDEIQYNLSANMDGKELGSDPGVPRLGKDFSSEKAVYEFYCKYAEKAGFKVRRGKAKYSGSEKSVITGKSFLCSCEGHKSKEQIQKSTRYKRQDTRTGCGAMIACSVNDGTWKISKVALEHNHDLKGSFAGVQEREEGSHTTRSLSTGEIADEVTDVDHGDVSKGTQKSCPVPGSDDTQDLIDYFKNMQIDDPFFLYTAQVEAAQGMANFFWRDSRSKVDYVHFGDVLVLDTRTRINKYDMICAAFWGLNHHQQRIIFGCAVMVNQNVRSFSWLLRSFLEAMSWQKPRTIITDVSEEIANALAAVLPETRHCLSPWSILNGFSKYLSPLIDQVDPPGLGDIFSECIYADSQEEFESKWNSVKVKSKLRENAWLTSLYSTREKWSHAFTKNAFSAGLLSIKNHENAHALFGNLSYETMTLYQIALWCGEAAKHMRTEEWKEDRRCEKDMENLIPKSPMVKEAQCLYTRSIFKMFQGELINSLTLAIENSGITATHCKFKLTEEGSNKVHTVKFDPSNLTLACSCGQFESVGILCFHALKVLNFKNEFKIPSHYLLKRWTKSAKDSLPVDAPNIGIAHDRNPVNSFFVEFMQKALHVAHVCATKKRKIMALKSIYATLNNIAKTPRTEEIADAVEDSDGNNDMGQTI